MDSWCNLRLLRGRPAACGTFSYRPLPAGSEAAKMAAVQAVSQAAGLHLEFVIFMLKLTPFWSRRFARHFLIAYICVNLWFNMEKGSFDLREAANIYMPEVL